MWWIKKACFISLSPPFITCLTYILSPFNNPSGYSPPQNLTLFLMQWNPHMFAIFCQRVHQQMYLDKYVNIDKFMIPLFPPSMYLLLWLNVVWCLMWSLLLPLLLQPCVSWITLLIISFMSSLIWTYLCHLLHRLQCYYLQNPPNL